MAAVSTAQPSGTYSQGAVPLDRQGSWGYPTGEVTEQNESFPQPKAYSYDKPSLPLDHNTRQPLSNQIHSVSLAKKSSRPELNNQRRDTNESIRAWRSNRSEADQLAVPARVSALGRKGSDLSGVSEPDSLLELYDRQSANRSATGSMDSMSKRRNHGEGKPFGNEEDLDDSDWIHRDKLLKIESREMAEAGLHLGRASSRTTNRSASRGRRNKERSEDGHQNGNSIDTPYSTHYLPDEKLTTPPIPDEEEDGPPMDWDLRTPEERALDAADPERGRTMEGHSSLGKRSYSRIPLSTSSPAPIPLDYIARNAPLPRSASNGWDEEAIMYPKSRSRAQSVGSQVLLDDFDKPDFINTPNSTAVTTPPPGSPTKARGPTKSTPSSRKQSVNASAQQRPRTRSAATRDTSSQQRPVTRNGSTPPASAHKRPEGDPPWLATMYKPDPRLPPEQQMLPTHAKRLMQEQWEREGKPGAVYDRDFNVLDPSLLQHNAIAGKGTDVTDPTVDPTVEETEGVSSNAEWPLRSPKSPSLQHGGYKTTPTVPQHNPIPQPQTPNALGVQSTVSGPSVQEKNEKEAGCGCCIIM